MPKNKSKIQEPRIIEGRYLKLLTTMSELAQGVISEGLEPLLRLWPSEKQDADPERYNPLRPTRRKNISSLSDSDIQRLWPGIDPQDVREYAPWATSQSEVVRLVSTGLDPSQEELQEYVKRAITAEKSMRPRPPGVETFEPSPPGPAAFIARPARYPPVVIEGAGFPIGTPIVRELTTQTISDQLGHVKFKLGEMFTEENISEMVTKYGNQVDRFQAQQLGRVLNIPVRQEVPGINGMIDQWRETNVNLIKNMSQSLIDDISRTVESAHMEGLRVEVLAQKLQERYGVNTSRAQLIARDQVLKLNGQITRHRQKSAGITHYRWITVGDERVREEHQALDGSIQSWDAPPSPGHPGTAIQCFPESTRIEFLPGIRKIYRAWYTGELTEIVTSTDESTLSTPNHPFLTNRGWIKACNVKIGDKLICRKKKRFNTSCINQNNHITIKKIFDFFHEIGFTKTITSANAQLYGDICPQQEIDIITIDWMLVFEMYPVIFKYFDELFFSRANNPALGPSNFDTSSFTFWNTLSSLVSCSDLIFSLISGHLTPLENFSLSSCSRLDPVFFENAINRTSTNPEFFCDFFNTHSFRELLDHNIVEVTDTIMGTPFTGHVYSFETFSGVYSTNTGIVKNCRCQADPIIPELEDQPIPEIQRAQTTSITPRTPRARPRQREKQVTRRLKRNEPVRVLEGDKIDKTSAKAIAGAMNNPKDLGMLKEGMRDITPFRNSLKGLSKKEVNQVVTKMSKAPFDMPIKIDYDPNPLPGFKAASLRDGRHRLQAAREAGAKEILAKIVTYDENGDIASTSKAIIPTGGNLFNMVKSGDGFRLQRR